MNPIFKRIVFGLVLVNAVSAGAAAYLFQTKRETTRLLHSSEDLTDRLASELVLVHEKLDEAKDQIRLKDRQMKQMRGEIAELKLQLDRVNLGNVVVSSTAHAQLPKPAITSDAAGSANGSVISVNTDYNFVIINLGARNGIREGMILSLHQDGAPAGELRVDMVDDTISAAALVGTPSREIRAGDPVQLT